jgi:hypothetical protein
MVLAIYDDYALNSMKRLGIVMETVSCEVRIDF